MRDWLSRLNPVVRDVLILVFLGAGLWLTSSGMWDLRGPDEGRYVQIAKELLSRDNWLYLTVNGEPYDQKPPLAFWLFALMLKAAGGEISAWAVRLPSVLAAIATVVMTYIMGRHSFGRRAGLFAALMLMTSPLFFDNAPTAELNMLYTAAITGALCAWITRPDGEHAIGPWRIIAFWVSLAAAFFIKGPLAFVVVFSVVGWEAWKGGSWATLRAVKPGAGAFFLGVLIGGWLYVQRTIYGGDFVKQQVAGETLNRVMAGDHGAPFWYYFPRLIADLFPWALLVFPLALAFAKAPRKVRSRLTATPYFAWFISPYLPQT